MRINVGDRYCANNYPTLSWFYEKILKFVSKRHFQANRITFNISGGKDLAFYVRLKNHRERDSAETIPLPWRAACFSAEPWKYHSGPPAWRVPTLSAVLVPEAASARPRRTRPRNKDLLLVNERLSDIAVKITDVSTMYAAYILSYVSVITRCVLCKWNLSRAFA